MSKRNFLIYMSCAWASSADLQVALPRSVVRATPDQETSQNVERSWLLFPTSPAYSLVSETWGSREREDFDHGFIKILLPPGYLCSHSPTEGSSCNLCPSNSSLLLLSLTCGLTIKT